MDSAYLVQDGSWAAQLIVGLRGEHDYEVQQCRCSLRHCTCEDTVLVSVSVGSESVMEYR